MIQDRKILGDLLADPETSATVLHAILLAHYKDELYGDPEQGIPPMDPVEIWVRVQEEFHTTVHDNNENKINAIRMALVSDAFYEDPLVFTATCLSLYDGDMGDLVAGYMEDLTVPEMLWGIYEVELNRDDRVEFSPRVLRLIDSVIAEEAEEKFEGEEATTMAYYEQILEAKRQTMFEEMRILEWPESIIRRIALGDITPRHDDEGKLQQAEI
jgi:hypothetical protein